MSSAATSLKTKTSAPVDFPRARGFVELLGRSNFSFLQGASHPEEMVEHAVVHGYDGIGLCDLNGVYGVVRGWEAVHSPSHFSAGVDVKKDFRYLIGSELTLNDAPGLVLMPMTKRGYRALCELITLGKRRAGKGFSRLSFAEAAEGASDCLAFLLPPWTEELYDRASAAFGDRLYLPVWKDLTWESLEFYSKALQLERSREAKLFVTQRPFFHARERKPAFDVLTCILHKTTLENARTRLLPNAERTLRPLEELNRLWRERPDLVERTLEIAARVRFRLDEIRYRYPLGQLPEGRTAHDHLRDLTLAGLHRRFPEGVPPRVLGQIEKELRLIAKLEYEDYFLTLYEICQFAAAKNILHQGRGSAANSVVCYALGITAVDPTKVDLLFERFISEERREPPDIDMDFEHERREEIIQHVYQKYGEKHAAMVCNVIRYRSRMAFRETAKVFGLELSRIDAAIQYMGRDGLSRLLDDPAARERFGMGDGRLEMILTMAQQIKGFPRHLGIHSGGFIITQDPINETVPVEKATMDGRFVVQWNKDDVNALKMMKLDLLSLGMLTCLRKCFDLLRQEKGLSLGLAVLPADDRPTYEMIGRAETVGVFQIESRAQMVTLPRLRPRDYYDLVVEVALIRPGPLQGGMVHPYLRRRKGLEPVEYADPRLEPILKRTLGVPLFQEQVMQMVVDVADFTPGEADELRRLMSAAWRRANVMEGVRTRVMSGLRANGISEEYAEKIFKTIEGFSNYGFPESHAASFALLTYASSYLKCHHPEVFACALLNSQPMGFYAPRTILQEIQRRGVRVRDVNVNRSSWDYSLEDGSSTAGWRDVRVGLRAIASLPREDADLLVETRLREGPFLDAADFVRRVRVPRASLQKLAAAGAFSDFRLSPRELAWHFQSVELDEGGFSFARSRLALSDGGASDLRAPLPKESSWDALLREYAAKNLSTEQHPLSLIRPSLRARNESLRRQGHVLYFDSSELPELRHGQALRVAGLLGLTQRPPTAKGFCFITLEDEKGFLNIIVPPDVYERDRDVIYSRSLFEIHGRLQKVDGVLNVKAQRVHPLAVGADEIAVKKTITGSIPKTSR